MRPVSQLRPSAALDPGARPSQPGLRASGCDDRVLEDPADGHGRGAGNSTEPGSGPGSIRAGGQPWRTMPRTVYVGWNSMAPASTIAEPSQLPSIGRDRPVSSRPRYGWA
jgi:hypothetical protein